MGLFGSLFGTSKPAPSCVIHPDDKDLIKAEDLEWWSNVSMDDCKGWEQTDNGMRLALYLTYKDEGFSIQDAGKKTRLAFPTYYYNLEHRASEKIKLDAIDAAIPYVLKNRVNIALQNGVIDKPSVKNSSSVNALIRKLIRERRL